MANDKNNDGKLTPDELSENEKQMLQGADQNGDGAIDRQELTAAVNSRNAPGAGSAFGGTGSYGPAGARGNAVMARFFKYDRNHDGRLAPNEVPAQSRAMLNGGDTNGDGFIDAGEFQALAARMGERAKAFGAGNNLNSEANNGGRSR